MKPTRWLGIIVLDTILTLLFIYFIPSDSQFSVITVVFGFTFVAVVPGYCLVSLLFQEGKLDVVEKAVLSVALSFSIAGLSGLFLGLSPIGITTSSLTISLSAIVLVLAFLAFIRKMKFRTRSTDQTANLTEERPPISNVS